MTPLDKLEAFVSENFESTQWLKEGDLRNWLLWASDNKYLFMAIDKDGNFQGAAIARPLDDLSNVRESKTDHNPDGDNIYVDLIVATSKNAFRLLSAQGVNRFGVRKTISMHRRGLPRYYDFRKFSFKTLTV